MNAKLGARVLGAGRMVIGAALLLAPRRAASLWVGDYSERPAVQALVRSVGVRDLVLGMIALHTVDHPDVGPRWQATCAVVDTVDLVASIGGAGDLPAAGVGGVTVLAGGAAAAGLYFSRALKTG